MSEYTTIAISKELREMLADTGKKRESYDKIIRRLLSSWEGKK